MLGLLRGKGRMLILLALLGTAIGAGATMLSANKAQKGEGKPTIEESPKQLIKLEEFVVNLADSDAAHYLKAEVVLEVRGAHAKEELHKEAPKVRDAVIEVLSSKYYDQILGAAGKESLKQEITKKLNHELEESRVVGVFFNSFAMQ